MDSVCKPQLLCPNWGLKQYWLMWKTYIYMLKTRLHVIQWTKATWFGGKIRKRTQKLDGIAGDTPHKDWADHHMRLWKVFFCVCLWIRQVFLEEVHFCVLKSGSCCLLSSWKHPTLGCSLRLSATGAVESWDCVQEEGLINKIYTPRICYFQGTSSPPANCANVSSA